MAKNDYALGRYPSLFELCILPAQLYQGEFISTKNAKPLQHNFSMIDSIFPEPCFPLPNSYMSSFNVHFILYEPLSRNCIGDSSSWPQRRKPL